MRPETSLHCYRDSVHLVCVKAVKALRLAKINIHTGSFVSDVHHLYRAQIQCHWGHLANKRHLGKLLEPQWGETPIT